MKTLSFSRYLIVAFAAWLCIGCATVTTPNPKDPLESYNRSMFAANAAIDLVALKPLARGYTAVVPAPVRECVTNVFDNLKVPFSAINNLLQGKVLAACEDVVRFTVNTVFGLGGCFDVASTAGIPHHKEDFGQTLGYWGVPAGPYLVLPFFGPSNIRDGASTVGQFAAKNPIDRNVISKDIDHVRTRNTVLGVSLVNTRANLLPATDALEKLGVDEYAFIRDGSIRRRQNQVYDGNPPDDE